MKIAVMLLIAGQASAACCGQRAIRRPVVVRTQQVVPVQTLFLVAPPSFYGAARYTPPAVAKQTRTESEQIISALTKIVKALAGLEQRLDAIEAGHVSPVANQYSQSGLAPPEPVPVVPLVVLQNCAKCHTAPEAKGGFDLTQLSDPRKALMAEAMVANGKMPLNEDSDPITLTPTLRKQLLNSLKGMK